MLLPYPIWRSERRMPLDIEGRQEVHKMWWATHERLEHKYLATVRNKMTIDT